MSNRTRRIVLAIFFALFMTTMVLMAVKASAEPTVDRDTAYAPAWAWSKDWKPCLNDEPQPTRCVWDAKHNGNGSGHSYLQTKRGVVIFMRHHDAHLLLLPLYAA